VLAPSLQGMARKRFVDWSFNHYLAIAPPSFIKQNSLSRQPV
jgi:hypothetical protein